MATMNKEAVHVVRVPIDSKVPCVITVGKKGEKDTSKEKMVAIFYKGKEISIRNVLSALLDENHSLTPESGGYSSAQMMFPRRSIHGLMHSAELSKSLTHTVSNLLQGTT